MLDVLSVYLSLNEDFFYVGKLQLQMLNKIGEWDAAAYQLGNTISCMIIEVKQR